MTNLPPWIEIAGHRFIYIEELFYELRQHAQNNPGSADSRALLRIVERYEQKVNDAPVGNVVPPNGL